MLPNSYSAWRRNLAQLEDKMLVLACNLQFSETFFRQKYAWAQAQIAYAISVAKMY